MTANTRIETIVFVGNSETEIRQAPAKHGDRVVQITFVHGRQTVSREFRMEITGLKIVPNTTKYAT